MREIGLLTHLFLRKSLRYGTIIFLIVSINFLIPHMMPGDPVTRLLGERALGYDEKVIGDLKNKYGLDKPLTDQYLIYLVSLSRLDLGFSINRKVYISELLMERCFWTLILILPSILIGNIIALLMGAFAGFKEGMRIDVCLSSLYIILFSCPSFLLTMVAIYIFCFHLDWFPMGSLSSGGLKGSAYYIDMGWHLLLPVAVLSAIGSTYIFMVVRSSIVQVKREYFIFVARAKGLSERSVRLGHVLPNILPPFISIFALQMGYMVAGDLIVEVLFSINGMGTLIFDAVLARDYPVMQGAFLVITVFILLCNFVADILYAVVDPRILDAGDKI